MISFIKKDFSLFDTSVIDVIQVVVGEFWPFHSRFIISSYEIVTRKTLRVTIS